MRVEMWVECTTHKKRFCIEGVPGWRHPIMTLKLAGFLVKHGTWLCRVRDRFMATQETRVWLLEKNDGFEIDEAVE